ncbi:TPA: AAA family ATPase [Citrobacter braakii]
MPKIRHIEVENFRVIKKLSWSPSPGLNCLIGPGDSGKSTILDAIDLALGQGDLTHLMMPISMV